MPGRHVVLSFLSSILAVHLLTCDGLALAGQAVLLLDLNAAVRFDGSWYQACVSQFSHPRRISDNGSRAPSLTAECPARPAVALGKVQTSQETDLAEPQDPSSLSDPGGLKLHSDCSGRRLLPILRHLRCRGSGVDKRHPTVTWPCDGVRLAMLSLLAESRSLCELQESWWRAWLRAPDCTRARVQKLPHSTFDMQPWVSF